MRAYRREDIFIRDKEMYELKEKWEKKFNTNKEILRLLFILSTDENITITHEDASIIFDRQYDIRDAEGFRGDICFDVKGFITNTTQETYQLPYDNYWLLHTIFAISSLSFLILSKYSNEYGAFLSFIYTFLLILIFSYLLSFECYRKYIIQLIKINSNNLESMLTLIISLCIVLLLNYLLKSKYKEILYVNFSALFTAFNVSTVLIRLFTYDEPLGLPTRTETTLLLINLFPVHLCFLFILEYMFTCISPLPKK